MSDIFDNETRTRIMQSIKSKNSKAELFAFRYLNRRKIYYRKHYQSKLKINIDIALPRKKIAVFIDGDFWHGRHYEKLVNQRGAEDYWTLKIKRNIERDKQQRQELVEAGWQVLTLWESDINRQRTRQEVLEEMEKFLKDSRQKGRC